MELRRLAQEPLRRERFTIPGLHVCWPQDTVRVGMQNQPGRQVLVAVITGEAGRRIQHWRERHDSKQAARLPPHLTLCYRVPDAPLPLVEAQVRHAFPSPVTLRLGRVFVLEHPEAPLAVSVSDTEGLDAARRRLFDGRYVQMAGRHEWPWHITCVRYGLPRDRERLLRLARTELDLDEPWTIEAISYLALRGGRYDTVAEWELSRLSEAERTARLG